MTEYFQILRDPRQRTEASLWLIALYLLTAITIQNYLQYLHVVVVLLILACWLTICSLLTLNAIVTATALHECPVTYFISLLSNLCLAIYFTIDHQGFSGVHDNVSLNMYIFPSSIEESGLSRC